MDKLFEKAAEAHKCLTDALLDYVREEGHDCTEEDTLNFGFVDWIKTEKVTKVIDFTKGNGCYFFECAKLNDDSLEGMDDDNWFDTLYSAATHTTYVCLYIVEEADGTESLKYYRFINGGLYLDEGQADAEHGYVDEAFPLLDIENILHAIQHGYCK